MDYKILAGVALAHHLRVADSRRAFWAWALVVLALLLPGYFGF